MEVNGKTYMYYININDGTTGGYAGADFLSNIKLAIADMPISHLVQTDEYDNCTSHLYYRDADNDTYGNPAVTTLYCTQPSGYVATSGDCNDGNAAVHPGAPEVCNGIDDNCNGQTDEGAIGSTWYRDADNDGYGTASVTTLACIKPSGYVANSTDCNDSNSAIHPGAAENPTNGIDDNCNGQTDEASTTHPTTGWYALPSMRRWYQPWGR